MLKVLILILSLIGAQAIFGHASHDEIDSAIGEEGSSPSNHAGYGYFYNGASEAATDRALSFDCANDAINNYLQSFCGDRLEISQESENLVNESMRALVIRDLRIQAVQFYGMNYTALNQMQTPPQSVSFPWPPCLETSDRNDPRLTGFSSTTPPPSYLDRRSSMMRRFDTKNMVQALAYGERLDKAWNDNNCSSPGVSGSARSMCLTLEGQVDRLHNSYPALWPLSRMDHSRVGSRESATFNFEAQKYQQFKNSIQSLLSTYNNQRGSDESNRNWNELMSNHNFITETQMRIDRAFDQAADDPNSPLAQAVSQLNTIGEGLRSDYKETVNGRIGQICRDAAGVLPATADGRRNKYQLSGMLAVMNPAILRQMMLDLPPDRRDLARAVLCESGLASQVRPTNKCHGITGGPLPSEITVDRRLNTEWPFGTQNYATFSQPNAPDDETTLMTSTVNIKIGPGLSAEQARETLNNWRRNTNCFYNCQTGQHPRNYEQVAADGTISTFMCPSTESTGCPVSSEMRNPPIRFKIDFNILSSEQENINPTVTLHKCFHANLPSDEASDCQRVYETALDRCQRIHRNTEEYCQEKYSGVDDPEINRANSSNIPISEDDDTVNHEIGHILGLSDEYPDGQRPHTALGERTSLMTSGNRLYPRHLEDLLSPTTCTQFQRDIADGN